MHSVKQECLLTCVHVSFDQCQTGLVIGPPVCLWLILAETLLHNPLLMKCALDASSVVVQRLSMPTSFKGSYMSRCGRC